MGVSHETNLILGQYFDDECDNKWLQDFDLLLVLDYSLECCQVETVGNVAPGGNAGMCVCV